MLRSVATTAAVLMANFVSARSFDGLDVDSPSSDFASVGEDGRRDDTCVEDDALKCKLYMAESTLPNAGMGLYTGVDLTEGNPVGYGDIVIPLIELELQHPDAFFLWADYYWNPVMLGSHFARELDSDGYVDENLNGCSPGLGAVINSLGMLQNVGEGEPEHDLADLHRRSDPGAGSFTAYHNRISRASEDVEAGSELFTNYGDSWFYDRTETLGFVPVEANYRKATKLLERYRLIRSTYNDIFTSVMESDLWGLVTNFRYEGRTINALPKQLDDEKLAGTSSVPEILLGASVRSLEWLEENGICLDNIRPGNSTIPQAGRGAFATRFIPKGELITQTPLIHIPDRSVLNMYNVMKDANGEYKRDRSSGPVGQQLLLNYCFGHRNSSVLLSPYGVVTSLINHSRNKPNAKIRWADGQSSMHNPDLLTKSPRQLYSMEHAGLAFDFIATRDILQGDEVLIDYGLEWEEAWNDHVESWVAEEGSENYEPASVLNADMDTPLRTVSEYGIDPYPGVELRCSDRFTEARDRYAKMGRPMQLMARLYGSGFCKILTREVVNGTTLYTTEVNRTTSDSWQSDVQQLPREAFVFENRPKSTDMHLRNTFRHEMMVPDDMFPTAWMTQ